MIAPTAGWDVSRAIERTDFWRRSPASAGGGTGHKEWHYFSVLADDLDLIVNLSIMDRRPTDPRGSAIPEEARVVILVRDPDGRWDGDVETCDRSAVTLHAGRIDARFGGSRVSFSDGAYRLDVRLGAAGLSASLALSPASRPAIARSVPLGGQEPMQWMVLPRLRATGEVQVRGRRYPFRASAAYHDHNWGRFAWGGDFAWEWGIVLGDGTGAWSLVYYRITDRGRHKVVAQGLLMWQEEWHRRTFRDGEIAVHSSGMLRADGCLRVPRVIALALPGSASDIPRRLEVHARSQADAVDLVLDIDDCAQIGIPDETGPGVTAITECHGRARVSGSVRGERIAFPARAVVEFNRAT